MASVRLLVLLNSFFMSGLSMDLQLIKVNPKQAIMGVFEVTLGNKYALNASAARIVCDHLGVTIASKAQVTEAQKHGLETCRYGWVDEQIAVVPRVHVSTICGKGKDGVVVWRTNLNILFDVFCFNLTDFEIQAAMAADQKSTEMPKTSTESSASSPPGFFSTAHNLSFNNIEEKHLLLSDTHSVGAVPVALLITVASVVLLAVILALYYFKMNKTCPTFWDVEQRQEDIETEVLEHYSKKDLQRPHEEIEEKENNNNNHKTDQE
nr:lymphatic vessel endothelial hyaluronic acid receptor 1a [Misgurnus anguillicaudatus]